MGKYFGTDGIRGVANKELDCTLAYKAGLATAYVLGHERYEKPLVLIGKDTRISGDMLESALTAGLCAGGADVMSLGVIPTPAVAFKTVATDAADAGIVISASHNSFEHNGIKIFGGNGYKLSDIQELAIENYIDSPPKHGKKVDGDIGRVIMASGSAQQEYAKHIIASCKAPLDGMKIVVDCACGASSATAPIIFKKLGAKVDFIAANPNGTNINFECGSTDLGKLKKAVTDGAYDCGIAFDGDADRCLMVDENGETIDGDKIIGILAKKMKNDGTLRGGVVVTTMSNLGLLDFLRCNDIDYKTTAVGDRYVLEQMREQNWNIGGEQSGHVILLDHCTTGDGEITAVQMLMAIKESGLKASEIGKEITRYPQVIVNVEMSSGIKHLVVQMDEVKKMVKRIAETFGEEGRIVVRPSGTEPLVRIMIEGKEPALVEKAAKKAAEVVKAEADKYSNQRKSKF